MENVSKALLIAGGILITIMLLTFFVYLSNNIKTVGQAQQDKKNQEQLIKFNQQYEAYNKSLLYGAEVLTVVNKVEDNNKKNNVTEISQNAYINVIVTDKDNNTISIEKLKTNLKEYVFQCIEMEYSNITGKVNNIIFKQKIY